MQCNETKEKHVHDPRFSTLLFPLLVLYMEVELYTFLQVSHRVTTSHAEDLQGCTIICTRNQTMVSGKQGGSLNHYISPVCPEQHI